MGGGGGGGGAAGGCGGGSEVSFYFWVFFSPCERSVGKEERLKEGMKPQSPEQSALEARGARGSAERRVAGVLAKGGVCGAGWRGYG